MTIYIRWMIRRDMPEVTAIDPYPLPYWNENEWIERLRQRNSIAMVAEIDNAVAGWMLYDLHAKRIHLERAAVSVEHQRKGVFGALMAKLESKLSTQRRSRIVATVEEHNLAAQLALRACGFFCDTIGEGCYGFTLHVRQRSFA